jgi:DNA helicase-2/ATP-dependent DNA helicase PcrA
MPDASLQKNLWEVRKAGLNIMMSLKGDGKPVSFIEDCAVPLESLAEYTQALTDVFSKYGSRGTWYAHASVGTLHVRPILDMRRDGAQKMRAVAEEASALVRKYKGAYSGEHGDGLCRGEWISWQFGPKITQALAEIKHALAYLRLLENPRDDTSFMRVVNFPPRGIGARSIEQLQDAARAMGCPLHDAVSTLTGKAGVNITAFVAKIDVLREQTQGQNLRQIIELLLDHSGLVEHYQSEREGADRIENLTELVNAAESFVTQEGFGREAVAMPVNGEMINPDTGETLSPLAAFLTHAALESGDNQAQAGQDAVQLMTVHASKGLEFDCVFITGMEEGLFPHENSMNDYDGLEEERRLMYVAITRARRRLYLSHSQTRMLHGQTRYNIKSRFFDELPEHALKWITPARSAFADAHASPRNAWQQPAWSNNDWQTKASAPTPVVQRPSAASGPNVWVRSGVQVFHTKFGEGTVIGLEGVGDDARAQVNFSRHGMKWLALSVAKLTQV